MGAVSVVVFVIAVVVVVVIIIAVVLLRGCSGIRGGGGWGVAVLPVEVVVEVGGVVVVARAFRPLLKAAAMAVSIGMGLLLLLA